MRWIIALALLGMPAIAQEPGKEVEYDERGDEFEYKDGVVRGNAFALEGHFARGERDAPAVFVRLKDAGVLQAKVRDAWQDTTLARLAEILEEARDADRMERVKAGKSHPGEVRKTDVFVSIEAEPTTPWQHVQWIATVAAEEKLTNLELRVGERSLLVVLPLDRAICGGPRPPLVLKAAIWVFARKGQPSKWGDAEVVRPTEVRFRIAGAETTDLGAVKDYLRGMKKKAEDTLPAHFYGELRVGHAVPLGKALDVMEAFVDTGIPSLDTGETFDSIPWASLREAKRLPYPKEPRRDPTGPPAPPSGD